MKISQIALIFLLIAGSSAQAQGPQKAAVMDFEADVIEGQKKAPELFLQLDSEKTELNSILYDRKNFNDFVPIGKLRPTFSDPKKVPVK